MNMISKLMLGQISKEQFVEINAITNIAYTIEQGLVEGYKNQNADGVEEYIYLTFVFEFFDKRIVDILNQLLVSEWHYKHEDIVLLLQKISCKESIEYLYNAIELRPQYLVWDDNYAFEKKCVRAIYYIGKEQAFSYLEKLCTNNNDVIREMAQKEIKKLM
ncbi:MAG: hypothetical protein IJN92_02695 [Lachnospiraceae bacterium]|nr:hypothetical protein [Lachnospiraceae bacterium]